MQDITTKIRDYFWSKQGIICKKSKQTKIHSSLKTNKETKNDTLAPESLE